MMLLIGFVTGTVFADEPGGKSEPPDQPERKADRTEQQESYNTGWSVFIDNDLLIGQDENYTGGFTVSLSGNRATTYFWSLDPVLDSLNDLTGVTDVSSTPSSFTRHSMDFGMMAFTPDDIRIEKPIEDDRPYAGLVFLSNTRRSILPDEKTTYTSAFTLGILGTDAIPEIQKLVHEVTDSRDPEGWDHQISDGGEPTLMYSLIREDELVSYRTSGMGDFDLKHSFGGSVGYITELQAGLNARWGNFSGPSWTYNPVSPEGVDRGPTSGTEGTNVDRNLQELYFWGGIQANLRGYNAFVQGQFRDSEVTFSKGELRTIIGEGAIGITTTFKNGLSVSISGRGRTRDIPEAEGGQQLWGSLMISQRF